MRLSIRSMHFLNRELGRERRPRSPRPQGGYRRPCRGAGRSRRCGRACWPGRRRACSGAIRSDAVLSHAPKLNRGQLCGRIRRTFAAWINSVRRYLLPRLEMRPRIERPPVLYCRGTRPSQAAEVAPAIKGLAGADRGDKAGRDQRPDAGNAHQPLTFGLGPAESLRSRR